MSIEGQIEVQTASREAEHSHRNVRTTLLLALPCGVIGLSLIVWVIAVSRSGFWADDFLWVTHFSRSLGNLSNDHFNVGKYVINVFWALGTEAFGAGSVIPFLILNSLVFAVGVVMWLWVGTKTRWSSAEAWWIGGLFIATAAWLPTTLWSSNITHSGGFLALGVGILAHERAMKTQSLRSTVCWSVVSGAAWTFAIASNLLYIGLVVIAIYCSWHQIRKLRQLGMSMPGASITVGFWNLFLPILYFVAVGYPGATASQPYSKTGLQFVYDNLRFYRSELAPTDLLTAVYALLLVGAAIGALVAVLRRRDFFPIAVLGAAGATAMPALVQSQQRFVHYMAMPLLLLFSAMATGVRPVLLDGSRWLKGGVLLASAVTLLLLFHQGEILRAYFVRTPYGSSLATFRSEVASLTPEGGTICANMNLDAPQENLFIAEISGENGFYIPPISAAHVYLVENGKPCPASGAATHITVSLNARGDLVASG